MNTLFLLDFIWRHWASQTPRSFRCGNDLQGDHLVRSLKFCFTTPIEMYVYWSLIGSNSSQTWSIWHKSLFAWYFSLYDPNSTSPFKFKKKEKQQNWHIWAMIDFQNFRKPLIQPLTEYIKFLRKAGGTTFVTNVEKNYSKIGSINS